MIKAPIKTNREWLAAFAAIKRAELAYTRSVSSPLPGAKEPLPEPGGSKLRRRRSATGLEQARRKAWGRTWGAVGAEYAKKLRAEGK